MIFNVPDNMNTPERDFYNYLRTLLPGHVHRIESIGSGIPDLNVCFEGKEIWIELKVFDLDIVLLRKEQYAWGMRRSAMGGNVFILCRHSDHIWVWKYPQIEVQKYGNIDVHVKVVNAPFQEITHYGTGVESKKNILKNILFT